MITGANSGIGKAAATGLAKMGARIVMVCRDTARGEEARSGIVRASGAKDEDVFLMTADLASLDSVRKLAADFLQTKQALHVLVNNAGAVSYTHQMCIRDRVRPVLEKLFCPYFFDIRSLNFDGDRASEEI